LEVQEYKPELYVTKDFRRFYGIAGGWSFRGMAPTVSLMMVPVLVLSLGACGGEEPAETDQALADQLQDQLEEPQLRLR